MRRLLLILLLTQTIGISHNTLAQEAETQYFSFHSDFWVNLHHFLYEKASGQELRKLSEDGLAFLDIGEDAVFEKLDQDEKAAIDNALDYYRESLIGKSLIGQGDISLWLQKQDEEGLIRDTLFSSRYTILLNTVSKVYREHFWPIHLLQNQNILKEQIETITRFESEIMTRMEALAVYTWPIDRIRIDLTAYGNWAGAYTFIYPTPNVFISTLDPASKTSGFIETVFHESSHVLFSRESGFRSRIFFMSKELEMEFPKHLWHASLFYLCGRAVQDALAEIGIDHSMIMYERNVFSKYHTPEFKRLLEEYYQGKIDMENTIKDLLSTDSVTAD